MNLLRKRPIQILLGIIIIWALANIALYEPDLPLDQLKASYANAQSKFIDIDGQQVHYRREGHGHPLVLIHGTGAMLQTWDEWTQALDSNYEVIRMDIPAFGLTGPRADNDYSDSMYVNFIDKFVRSQNLDTFYLAGNSLGGLIAWKYAAAHPEKVKKLVLVDPAGFHSFTKANGSFIFKLSREHPGIASFFGKIGTHFLVNHTLHEVFSDDTKVTTQKLKLYTDLNRREGNRRAFVERAKFIHESNEADLKKITSPTLVLWGNDDVLIDVREAAHFKTIPNSTFIFYPSCGHVPQEEIPARSAMDVREFLK